MVFEKKNKKVQPDVYATTPDRTFIFRNWCVICITSSTYRNGS